jgi:hypothetical protein
MGVIRRREGDEANKYEQKEPLRFSAKGEPLGEHDLQAEAAPPPPLSVRARLLAAIARYFATFETIKEEPPSATAGEPKGLAT